VANVYLNAKDAKKNGCSVPQSVPLAPPTPAPIASTAPPLPALSSLSVPSLSLPSRCEDRSGEDRSGKNYFGKNLPDKDLPRADATDAASVQPLFPSGFENTTGSGTFNGSVGSQDSVHANAAQSYVANAAGAYEQSASAAVPSGNSFSALAMNAAALALNTPNLAEEKPVAPIKRNLIEAVPINITQAKLGNTNVGHTTESQGTKPTLGIADQTLAFSFSGARPVGLSSFPMSPPPMTVACPDDSSANESSVDAVQNAETVLLAGVATATDGTIPVDDNGGSSDGFPRMAASDSPPSFKDDPDIPGTIDLPAAEVSQVPAAAPANSQFARPILTGPIQPAPIQPAVAPAVGDSAGTTAPGENPAPRGIPTPRSPELPGRNSSSANLPTSPAKIDAAIPSHASFRANLPALKNTLDSPSQTPGGTSNSPILPPLNAPNDLGSSQPNHSIDSRSTTPSNAASQTTAARNDNSIPAPANDQASARQDEKQDGGTSDSSASDSSPEKVSASTLQPGVPPAAQVAAAVPGVASVAGPAPTPATAVPASAPSIIPSGGSDVGRSGKAAPSAPDPPSSGEPQPVAPAGPVQMAQIVSKAAQSEMRVGLTTSAFGNVEVRTMVRANEVGVLIGSEKGDLHSLMATELPGIANTLQQQNLRLNQVNFHHGSSFSNQSFSGDGSGQRAFSPRAAPGSAPAVESGIPESGESAEISNPAPYGSLSVIA
jgi:hypothetical protein